MQNVTTTGRPQTLWINSPPLTIPYPTLWECTAVKYELNFNLILWHCCWPVQRPTPFTQPDAVNTDGTLLAFCHYAPKIHVGSKTIDSPWIWQKQPTCCPTDAPKFMTVPGIWMGNCRAVMSQGHARRLFWAIRPPRTHRGKTTASSPLKVLILWVDFGTCVLLLHDIYHTSFSKCVSFHLNIYFTWRNAA